MRIAFTVYGNPVPKGRPRVVRLKNGKSLTFTPDKTAAWEESIQGQALKHMPERLLEGPLAVTMTFYFVKPASARRRKYPHVRPDLDNAVKSVKDALNGLMWKDDAQIVDLIALKRYDSQPRVEIVIEELEEESA